eukprot:19215-Heterococcus_DN1.PRE.2
MTDAASGMMTWADVRAHCHALSKAATSTVPASNTTSTVATAATAANNPCCRSIPLRDLASAYRALAWGSPARHAAALQIANDARVALRFHYCYLVLLACAPLIARAAKVNDMCKQTMLTSKSVLIAVNASRNKHTHSQIEFGPVWPQCRA